MRKTNPEEIGCLTKCTITARRGGGEVLELSKRNSLSCNFTIMLIYIISQVFQ